LTRDRWYGVDVLDYKENPERIGYGQYRVTTEDRCPGGEFTYHVYSYHEITGSNGTKYVAYTGATRRFKC
jgi:hypothetical protein